LGLPKIRYRVLNANLRRKSIVRVEEAVTDRWSATGGRPACEKCPQVRNRSAGAWVHQDSGECFAENKPILVGYDVSKLENVSAEVIQAPN